VVVVVGAPLFTVVGRCVGVAVLRWLVVVVGARLSTVIGRRRGCDCFDSGWVVVLVTKGNTFCLCLVFAYFFGV